jgi:hypothetical protein
MPEPKSPLPANRAFVIQLRAETPQGEVRHRGRVEHLSSGKAVRFAGRDGLWAFIDHVLTALDENPATDLRTPTRLDDRAEEKLR